MKPNCACASSAVSHMSAHLNGTVFSRRPRQKKPARQGCAVKLYLQCPERPARQAAVAGCHRLLPRSPAVPGLLWAFLEPVLGPRYAPAAAWSPVGVYKGPAGPCPSSPIHGSARHCLASFESWFEFVRKRPLFAGHRQKVFRWI